MAVLVNLRKRYELRRAAHKRHPQTHAIVKPPKSPSKERRRKESPESESEDNGIVEYVQGKGESTQSWLTKSVRKAAAYGRQKKSSDHDVTTPTPNPRDPDLEVITLKIVDPPQLNCRIKRWRQNGIQPRNNASTLIAKRWRQNGIQPRNNLRNQRPRPRQLAQDTNLTTRTRTMGQWPRSGRDNRRGRIKNQLHWRSTILRLKRNWLGNLTTRSYHT